MQVLVCWCVRVRVCVLEIWWGYLKSLLVGDQGKHSSVTVEVLSCGVTEVVSRA